MLSDKRILMLTFLRVFLFFSLSDTSPVDQLFNVCNHNCEVGGLSEADLCLHSRRLGFERQKGGGDGAFIAFMFLHLYIELK